MISVPEVVIEHIWTVHGNGEPLVDLAVKAARSARGEYAANANDFSAVIAATFSNPERFPALSVRVASALGLPCTTLAFDLQLACSAYPYAVYLAGRIAADTGRKVLLIDGDVQSRLVDCSDHATGNIFSDAVTATVVSSSVGESAAEASHFDFLSRADNALSCGESGPIHMDGFKVFSFVAAEVSKWLKGFVTAVPAFDLFAPHQANPYMVRQLAKSLALENKLLTIPDELKNPGSCSVALALSQGGRPNARVLIAGFGAGYSAAAGIIRLGHDFVVRQLR